MRFIKNIVLFGLVGLARSEILLMEHDVEQ